MQVRKLSYLAIDRLGELLGLTADALSPIYDLRSAILQLKEAMPPELKEGLDAQLLAEGSLTEQAEGLQPADSMKLLLTALYCPKKCYRVQMQEKDGTGRHLSSACGQCMAPYRRLSRSIDDFRTV